MDFEIRISDTGAMASGAFRTGTHDDLVTALGLSVLESVRPVVPVSGAGLAAANAYFWRPSLARQADGTSYRTWSVRDG
jgi:hypothetical protein